MRMQRSLAGPLLLAALLITLIAQSAVAAGPEVLVLRVEGVISPPQARYVERGLRAAEQRGATAVVIQMDTPGGLDESMRAIIQDILASPVPVVVYVGPPGARAASAGAFITIASHVAAMAPGTEIGAATPVSIGETGEQKTPSALERKVVNDAVAYIRSLADLRGRNADWAESAVRDAASVPSSKALSLGVVDLVAEDLPSLLRQLDGRQVTVVGDHTVTLRTSGATVTTMDMTLIERFLTIVSNPNIAFILLSLGTLAIFFELSNPGAIFPGVTGAILLLVSLFALGTLPVNWAGVALLGLAFALFIAEIFFTSHGLLAVGGVVALVLGALLLISGTAPPEFQINRWLIVGVAGSIAAFFAFVVRAITQSQRRAPAIGGPREYYGKTAIARTTLDPEGMVYINGEYWQALVQNGKVEAGQEVKVTGREGMKLHVVAQRPGEGGGPP